MQIDEKYKQIIKDLIDLGYTGSTADDIYYKYLATSEIAELQKFISNKKERNILKN